MTATDSLAATRQALHAVAEHVLAAGRYQAVGRIGLTVVPGGFATPPFGPDDRVLAVVHGALVVRDAAGERREVLTTLRAAADFAGVTPGAPANVYPPATSCDLDAPLAVDLDPADRIAEWYALGEAGLRTFSAQFPDDEPSGITLWPEHFDVAIRAAEVNYGASPGDDTIAEPYLYVGPSPGVLARADEFWAYPFGAARTWSDVRTVEAAVEFFRAGRARAASLPG